MKGDWVSQRAMKTAEVAEERTSEVARHIARCAARLFATQGYDRTPVSAIVEEAGVTKPTLYYHFGSKEALARSLLLRPIHELLARMDAILAEEKDSIRVMERLIEENFAFSGEDLDRTRFMFALSFGPTGPEWTHELHRAGELISSKFVDAAVKMAEAGIIRAESVQSCACSIWGQVVIWTMHSLYGGQTLDSCLPSRLVAELLWGFATPEPPPTRLGGKRHGSE
jgi:AcrR family transcriptional regulator